MEAKNNEFYYSGCLIDDWKVWSSPLKGYDCPDASDWGKKPFKYDMDVVDNSVDLIWHGEVQRSWSADIDGDMIPDLQDEEPLVYNVDNPSVEIDPDVVAVDNDLNISVCVDFNGEDHVAPKIQEVDGEFEHSIGKYVHVELDTEFEYKGVIKFGYDSQIPSSKYLRVYRKNESGWIVVTDWENEEYTGNNIEQRFSWASVNDFKTFTLAPANLIDGESDGLSDLTEGTEPGELSKSVYTEEDFNKQGLRGTEDTAYLELSLEEYSIFTAVGGYIELRSIEEPVKDLEIDIGADGEIDWRASKTLDGILRVGPLRRPINIFLLENHINTKNETIFVPFVFKTSNDVAYHISNAEIEIEERITSNRLLDTSGDGLNDGWVDKNNDMNYVREGNDGILGTNDDNIPGAIAYGLDPIKENKIGGMGKLSHNAYHKGMSEVNVANGNLMLEETDLGFNSLAFDMFVKRTYNSQNTENGPLGPGWSLNFDQRLDINGDSVDYIDESGAQHSFVKTMNGLSVPEVDNPYSLMPFLPPEIEAVYTTPNSIRVDFIQDRKAEEFIIKKESGDDVCGYRSIEYDSRLNKRSVVFGADPIRSYTISIQSVYRNQVRSDARFIDVGTPWNDETEIYTDSYYEPTEKSYYVVRSSDGVKREFETNGRLIHIEDINRNKLYFDYENGNLI
ncbi:MAG: DUF6531 domain-containing protein, partial [Thermoplasmatota archaeon]